MGQSIMHDQRDGPIGGEVREKQVSRHHRTTGFILLASHTVMVRDARRTGNGAPYLLSPAGWECDGCTFCLLAEHPQNGICTWLALQTLRTRGNVVLTSRTLWARGSVVSSLH